MGEAKREDSNTMVSVICTAFNHERYIEQCLESLANQKTNFGFEVLVHDDASTDNTAAIIKKLVEKYPNIIKPLYQKENQFSKGVCITSTFLLPLAKGKYLAWCEGDDFWTDENKLQKQFDYMQAHPKCVLCGHAAYYANEDGSLRHDKYFDKYHKDKIFTVDELILNWSFSTNSMMYCKEIYPNEIPYRGDSINEDFALIVWYALHGEVHYLKEKMSAYRYVSINSLGDKQRKNDKVYIDVRKKYIAMLERLDEYTNYQYHEAVLARVDEVRFSIYIKSRDLKKVKLCGQYKKLLLKQKILLNIQIKFPNAFYRWMKIIGKCEY